MLTKCGLSPPKLFTMNAFDTPGALTIAVSSEAKSFAFSSIDFRIDPGMLTMPASVRDMDKSSVEECLDHLPLRS
jgi:hypothetical protein